MNGEEIKKTVEFYDKQLEIGVAGDYALRTDGRRIAELLRDSLPADASLLDLGCSIGLLADRLATHGVRWRRYVGMDLSEKAIEVFRERRLSGAEPLVGDATDLSSFPPESFDAVVCTFLLQDLTKFDGSKLLEDIRLILKPNGCLVLALTVHPQQPRELGGDYKPQALAEKGVPGKFTYLWSMKELTEALTQRGFSEQQVHQGQTPAGLIEIYGSWRAAQPSAAPGAQAARR